MKWTAVALLLVFASAFAETKIYKWVMPDGTVTYSDRPQEAGAEQVELDPLMIYTPPPLPARTDDTQQPAADADGYDSFRIASPADGSIIRDNAGRVTVDFSVSPSLVKGHVIDVYLDGKKFGRVGGPLVVLSPVSRGSHELYGVIVDESGAERARSDSIGFHLQRAIVPGAAQGGAAGPGGPASPGGPAGPGGPANPGGPASPGGPQSGGGATP